MHPTLDREYRLYRVPAKHAAKMVGYKVKVASKVALIVNIYVRSVVVVVGTLISCGVHVVSFF